MSFNNLYAAAFMLILGFLVSQFVQPWISVVCLITALAVAVYFALTQPADLGGIESALAIVYALGAAVGLCTVLETPSHE